MGAVPIWGSDVESNNNDETFDLENMSSLVKRLMVPGGGHFSAPTFYFRIRDLSIQEQMVLLVMHSYIHPRGGTLIVNRATFAKECRMTPMEVKEALSSLQTRGLYRSFLHSLALTGNSEPRIQPPYVSDYDAVKYYAPYFDAAELQQQIHTVTPEQAGEARAILEKKIKDTFRKPQGST